MGAMTARTRVGGLVIAYAVLVDASNACDAVDEVAVAAESWTSAAGLLRACGYRKVPRRAVGDRVPDGAVEAAFARPGTVFRKRFMADTPWTPATG